MCFFKVHPDQRRQHWLLAVFAFFVSILPVINILSAKTITLQLGLWAPTFSVGAFGYALTFPCTDVITEMWGKQRARFMVFLGIIVQLGAMAYEVLVIYLPPSPEFAAKQQAFAASFVLVPRIVGASLLSYWISEWFDIHVFSFIRRFTGCHLFWQRVTFTTTVSQALDTIIFIPAAFLGTEILPWGQWNFLAWFAFCQWAVKASLTLVIIPACSYLRWVTGYSNPARVSDEDWRLLLLQHQD